MFIRLLMASALAVGLASAQRGGGGGGGDSMGADSSATAASGAMRIQRQSKLDVVADKLHLSKDQKAQAATIFSAAQEEMSPINEQIRQGRNVVTSAIIEGKAGDELDKLMADYRDLLAQKAVVEAKAYGKLYAILDAKQQAKAAPVFEAEMDGAFDGGRRGGNRGGR